MDNMGRDLKGKELGVGITQRKDGAYQARFKNRWGKRCTIYDRDLRELRKKLSIAISENELFTSIRDNVTLDKWFKIWLEVYKCKSVRPNTLREYVMLYDKCISPYIGGRSINTLVKSDIQRMIDIAYELGYGYERQNKIKIVLRDMLQRALEDQLVNSNPVSGIKLRAYKEVKAVALSLEEQQIFFKYCEGTFYDNLFNVAVNTGLRPGELFALELDDINLKDGYIDINKTLVYQKYLTDEHKTFHVEPPKTRQSYRRVPINSICKLFLEKQLLQKKFVSRNEPKQQNSYLFTTKYNTPLNSVIYSEAIQSVIKKINRDRPEDDQFTQFSGHTLRHTFATRCFEKGINAKVVQSYLGHASLKMTMDLYVHVTAEKSSEDIEKIIDIKANTSLHGVA